MPIATPSRLQVELSSTLDAAAVRDDRELQKYFHEGRPCVEGFAALVLLYVRPGKVVS